MKKQILNLGKALNKAEQRNVTGGFRPGCTANVHFSECNVEGPGTVFYPYFIGNNPDPSGNGDCCIFLT